MTIINHLSIWQYLALHISHPNERQLINQSIDQSINRFICKQKSPTNITISAITYESPNE